MSELIALSLAQCTMDVVHLHSQIRHRSSLTSLWPPNKEEPARVCGTSPPLDNVHYVKLLPRFLLLCLHRVRRDRAPYRKRLAQRAELLDVRDRLTGR